MGQRPTVGPEQGPRGAPGSGRPGGRQLKIAAWAELATRLVLPWVRPGMGGGLLSLSRAVLTRAGEVGRAPGWATGCAEPAF